MYKIAANRFEAFQAEFAKLVKFAEKTGSAIPTFDATMIYDKKRGYVYDVEIQGLAPKYDGWEFVARIDTVEKIITGLKSFPQKYREHNGFCNHCNTNHQRVKTYIIQKEDEFMEVGGACLKKYTGGLSPEKIARQFEIINSLLDMNYDDFEENGPRGYRDTHNNIHRFISLAKSLKDKYGYVKTNSEGDDVSTGEFAYRFVTWSFPTSEEAQYYAQFHTQWATQHLDYAQSAIDYVMGIERKNDFILNLQQILRNGYFTQRSHKILAAIVQVYDAYVLGEQQRKIASLVSAYQGNIKDKLSVEVTVSFKLVTFGYYSPQTWLLMKDDNGNVYSWNASKELDVVEGDVISITGTVKEHKQYKDVAQTVLTRCKLTK